MIQPMISHFRLQPADLTQERRLPGLADGIRPADLRQLLVQPRDLVVHDDPSSKIVIGKAAGKSPTAVCLVREIFLLRR